MKFTGTNSYVASDDLRVAVNAAIALQRPLLIKGEPGTGKTVLAHEVAKAIGAPLDRMAHQVDHQGPAGPLRVRRRVAPARQPAGRRAGQGHQHYIKRGKLWDAFTAAERPVLLIDEIDKADIEFPNDLLLELDRMEFYVYETQEVIKAVQRPMVMITSNNEKELPDAFLRRCFFHYIRFPDRETMTQIVDVHFPDLQRNLLREALNIFYDMRDVPGLKKKPSTSELLDWLKLLMVEDIPPEALRSKDSKQAHSAAARRPAQERAGRASVRAAGLHGAAGAAPVTTDAASSAQSGPEVRDPAEAIAMFINFFLELREAKVPVSIKEYLTLMEAHGQGRRRLQRRRLLLPRRARCW